MSSELTICREVPVIWAGEAVKELDPRLRASWEAHVFHPGDRVTVDPDLDAPSRDRIASLIEYARLAGSRGLTVAQSIITVCAQPTGFSFTATCAVEGLDGFWPHESLIDTRPIDRIYGAVVTRGISTWLIPLVDGSVARDHARDAVSLKPRLERRARLALGAERIRDLAPFAGEFLVARGRGETGSVFAALWTSPLRPDELAEVDVMLNEIRSESYNALRHRGPLHGVPHRFVVVQ